MSFRSNALWTLGYPQAALADTEDALKRAREIGQAVPLMYALCVIGQSHILLGNYAAAVAQSDEVATLADEKGALQWKAIGMLNQGGCLALTGRSAEAVEMLSAAMAAYRSTGTTIRLVWRLSHLARAYAELGQLDESWHCIGEALTMIETTKEKWSEPEVNRVAVKSR